MTKTPEITWHHESCHYRLFFEAGAFVFKYRDLLSNYNELNSTYEALQDEYEWIDKGNQEFHSMLEAANAAVKQANLERDGYKYRLEQLGERDWEKINEVYS